MSKLTKLIKKPRLFFKDMVLNMMGDKVTLKSQQAITNLNIFSDFKFILHIGDNNNNNSLHHLKIWYPYFVESKIKFMIVVRTMEAFIGMQREYPEANIVYAKNKSDIDDLFLAFPTILACFYTSNTGNNFHLLYKTHIKHIFIGHGDSDKTSSAHKFFRVYDENWVAGDAHIDRIINAGFELNGLQNIKVGRPTLSNILKQTKIEWRGRFQGVMRVLYLPTWEGYLQEQDYSSLENLKDNLLLMQQIENIEICLKMHPFSGKRSEKFLDFERGLEEYKVKIIPRTKVLENYIGLSNLFVCDISAVVSECLAANAPIFLYIPKNKNIKMASSNMPYEYYCYIYSTPEELHGLMERVLKGDDYLGKNRLEAQEYIINRQDTINNSFVKRLKELGSNYE